MATIGLDCQLILHGTGYFIEPASFVVTRPRVRRAQHTRQVAVGGNGAGERYIDTVPGKAMWTGNALDLEPKPRKPWQPATGNEVDIGDINRFGGRARWI